MVVLTLLSHYGHFHGDWYQTIDTRSHYKHMVIDITLRTQGDWYYICMYTVNIWWLISHYGCMTDITLISHLGLIHGDWYHWYHTTDLYMMTDITLISHFGLIHGDWYHWYHTTDTYMVKETAEQSGESPPTYPVSNISRDPSHCDWRIQLFGSRSSVTLPVKSHCKDTSADPTVPLNKLLEIRLSRNASIKSRDMVSRGIEKDFGVLLSGSGEMTVHVVLLVALLVLCLWRR